VDRKWLERNDSAIKEKAMKPGESKADKQALQDEVNAEARYKAFLAQAELSAKQMAEDQTKSEAARAAAAEAETALRKIEEARLKAAEAPDAPAAKHTFMQWLKGYASDGQR
jgi:hypothetical protein